MPLVKLEPAVGLLVIYGMILISFLISGICLLSISGKEVRSEFVVNYTDCIKVDDDVQTCMEYLKEPGNDGLCLCDAEFELKEDLKGVVTLFYELDSYHEFIGGYVSSRDPSQWSGKLSPVPSEACEPFRFAHTSESIKPIAPCGALADAMFNDSVYLYDENLNWLSLVETGIIPESEKNKYRNPPDPEAFENFTKPVNWRQPIWKLSESDPENNGFKNERFIGWMETDWTRKPLARVNHTAKGYETGVPKGKYQFRVVFTYPPSRYNRTRRIILEAVETQTKGTLGGVFLGVGLFLLIGGFICLVLYKKEIIKLI